MSTQTVLLELRDGELVPCEHDGLLRVVHGRVWITRIHDPDDHFLETGQALALRAGTLTLVGAEGPARVALEISRSAPRLPSRTIATWLFPPTSSR